MVNVFFPRLQLRQSGGLAGFGVHLGPHVLCLGPVGPSQPPLPSGGLGRKQQRAAGRPGGRAAAAESGGLEQNF